MPVLARPAAGCLSSHRVSLDCGRLTCRLIVYICFNAFPDYDEQLGWEGSLSSISSLMCCGEVLERTEVQGR